MAHDEFDVGRSVREPAYRPPNGAEIIFSSGSASDGGTGLYRVDVATETLETILEPTAGVQIDRVTVAPDGSRVAYSVSTIDPTRNTYLIHVRTLDDGSGLEILPMPETATFQDAPAWSNDSTRIIVVRGYAAHNQAMTLAVLPADGSTVGIESARGLTGCCDTVTEWSPDDTSILVSPYDLAGNAKPQILLDPLTGASRPAPWVATSDPAWQRRAP